MKTHLLPTNDLAFGVDTQRMMTPLPAWMYGWWWCQWLPLRRSVAQQDQFALQVGQACQRLSRLDEAGLQRLLSRVSSRLRGEGLSDRALTLGLAVAAQMMQRQTGLTPYDAQILAARELLRGKLAEMQTGEGKTLATALAAAVAAVGGSSVVVLTANEYLVERDEAALRAFYESMGLTTGCITAQVGASERGQIWRRAIVYSTASELAFDYLRDYTACQGDRDPLLRRARALNDQESKAATPVLPGLCVCFADEADSLLLDDAVVPLILASAAAPVDEVAYRKAYGMASQLNEREHYLIEPGTRRVQLTRVGLARVADKVEGETGDLYPCRRACELVAIAVAAQRLYYCDRDYVVLDSKVQLVDQMTGRIAHGRQWQSALQQMVEIKEAVELSAPASMTAQITYQQLFPRFRILAGTSGTLSDARREMGALYGLQVVPIRLSFASQRRILPEIVVANRATKWQCVAAAVRQARNAGRPVLIGTESVADSNALSAVLTDHEIDHQVLHATQYANEAALLKRAGRAGVVTVATNMAGRGTDIVLSGVARRHGGLHVIATMRNRSRRIDRQLVGRAARQGDPGSCQSIVSLNDSLLEQVLHPLILRALRGLFRIGRGRPGWLFSLFIALAQGMASRTDRLRRHALKHNEIQQRSRMGFAGQFE